MKKAYTHVVSVKCLYLDINMFAVKACLYCSGKINFKDITSITVDIKLSF